ncbi:MAG: 4Fe-4S binding protein [Methanothrix sp.]|nr:4Fe-4S binding protein [Methanothrix sp.]
MAGSIAKARPEVIAASLTASKTRMGVTVALAASAASLLVFGLFKNMDFIRSTATYGNFDVPGTESWVMKLSPGISDLASSIVYGNFHIVPLIFIGTLFILMLAASLYKNTIDLVPRMLTLWSMFALSRLGVFRVSGICPVSRTTFGSFNFLNCQACEMATGACPIGMMQWSLMKGEFPALVLGVVVLSGALLGRAVCGWMCPFGFLSDVLDRISQKRLHLPAWLGYAKFLVLAFLFTAFLWPSALFCTYLCQSGTVFGITPYYLTTGLPALKLALQGGMTNMLYYHLFFGLLLVLGVVLVSGRWFCRYLCPLGATYGLFNYISPLKVLHSDAACNHCGQCSKLCPMDVKKENGSFLDVTGCIKCGRCVKACKMNARSFSWSGGPLAFPKKNKTGKSHLQMQNKL